MGVRLRSVSKGKAGLAAATLVAGATVGTVAAVTASPALAHPHTARCQLGHGVQHVINIVFDNVHFFRDNPNVPSDLEQMPHLLSFLEYERHGVLELAHADDRPHRG